MRGMVEDVGFGADFPSSGYKETFDPDRFKRTELG